MDPVTLGMAKADAKKRYGAFRAMVYLDPSDKGVLRFAAQDGGLGENLVGDVVGDDLGGGTPTLVRGSAALLGPDGKIPAKYGGSGGGGGTVSGSRTNLTVATGFAVPAWGVTPSTMTVGPDRHLAGHIARAAADIVVSAVLCTGTFTAGKKSTAVTDTGVVLLVTTSTQITVSQILVGASPTWVSLDGVIV